MNNSELDPRDLAIRELVALLGEGSPELEARLAAIVADIAQLRKEIEAAAQVKAMPAQFAGSLEAVLKKLVTQQKPAPARAPVGNFSIEVSGRDEEGRPRAYNVKFGP